MNLLIILSRLLCLWATCDYCWQGGIWTHGGVYKHIALTARTFRPLRQPANILCDSGGIRTHIFIQLRFSCLEGTDGTEPYIFLIYSFTWPDSNRYRLPRVSMFLRHRCFANFTTDEFFVNQVFYYHSRIFLKRKNPTFFRESGWTLSLDFIFYRLT